MKEKQQTKEIEVSAILNLKDYEREISLVDFVGTLQKKEHEKNMILRIYQQHKGLKTVKEWQILIN